MTFFDSYSQNIKACLFFIGKVCEWFKAAQEVESRLAGHRAGERAKLLTGWPAKQPAGRLPNWFAL